MHEIEKNMFVSNQLNHFHRFSGSRAILSGPAGRRICFAFLPKNNLFTKKVVLSDIP